MTDLEALDDQDLVLHGTRLLQSVRTLLADDAALLTTLEREQIEIAAGDLLRAVESGNREIALGRSLTAAGISSIGLLAA